MTWDLALKDVWGCLTPQQVLVAVGGLLATAEGLQEMSSSGGSAWTCSLRLEMLLLKPPPGQLKIQEEPWHRGTKATQHGSGRGLPLKETLQSISKSTAPPLTPPNPSEQGNAVCPQSIPPQAASMLHLLQPIRGKNISIAPVAQQEDLRAVPQRRAPGTGGGLSCSRNVSSPLPDQPLLTSQ